MTRTGKTLEQAILDAWAFVEQVDEGEYFRDGFEAGYKLGQSDALQWTRHGSKLPPLDTPVLISLDGYQHTATWDGEYYWISDSYRTSGVTHWMPLPKAPEAK